MLADTEKSRIARFVLIGVITAVASLAVAGCGDSDDPSSTEASTTGGSETVASVEPPAGLMQADELRVCTDPTYPPLESFDENGDYVGFDIDVARAVAESWGIEAAFQETAFAGILPALDSGRCDVAWSGLFVDPERTKRFSAVPFQTTASVLMVAAGNPAGITSTEDLAGKTVATQNGSNLLKLAQQVSDDNVANGLEASNVQGYDKFNEAIQQLVVGRADAVVTQDIDAAAREAAQPGQFEVGYTFDDAETFAVYYKPDNPEIGDRIYESLLELEKAGQLEQMANDNLMPVDGIDVQKPIVAEEG